MCKAICKDISKKSVHPTLHEIQNRLHFSGKLETLEALLLQISLIILIHVLLFYLPLLQKDLNV